MFVTDTSVQVVTAAAVDGVIEAEGSDAGPADTVQIGVFVTQVIAEDVVADGHFQAVLNDRDGVVSAPVEHVAARRGNAGRQVVPFVGQVAEIVVDAIFVIAHGTAAVVVARD